MRAIVRLLPRSVKRLGRRLLESLSPPLPQPYMPADFAKVVADYETSSKSARTTIALGVIERLLSKPADGVFLSHSSCAAQFGHSDIYHHAIITLAYAGGDTADAERMAADLASRHDTALNRWLHVRTLAGQAKIADALEAVTGVVKAYPDDASLLLELASLLNLSGRVKEANAVLVGVSSAVPYRDQAAFISELSEARRTGAMARTSSGDIYTDSYVADVWWRYWRIFITQTKHQWTDPLMVAVMVPRLSEAVQAHGIKTLIDFGAFCGEANYQIAKALPDLNMVGVDRQEIIKSLNDAAYQLPNLSFVAGDIFAEIERHHASPVALTHTRTCGICTPAFVQALYDRCKVRGINHIIGFEPSGISREIMAFPDQDTMSESIAFRGIMIIHPYRKMLEQSGYRVTRFELVPFEMLYFDDPGMHMVYFEAELV